MKRDMDLVRELLFDIESDAPREGRRGKGRSDPEIAYHLVLMEEAGFIAPTASDWTRTCTLTVHDPVRLTWAGHEFLDQARDLERWKKARAIIHTVGGAGLDALKAVLSQLAIAAVTRITGGAQ